MIVRRDRGVCVTKLQFLVFLSSFFGEQPNRSTKSHEMFLCLFRMISRIRTKTATAVEIGTFSEQTHRAERKSLERCCGSGSGCTPNSGRSLFGLSHTRNE